jgi:hypothetical protein
MAEQRSADAAALMFRQHVGVADQVDVPYRLYAHHADQGAVPLDAPERNSARDFVVQLACRHIRLMPAISGNDAAIGLGGGVNDREDRFPLVVATAADINHHQLAPSFRGAARRRTRNPYPRRPVFMDSGFHPTGGRNDGKVFACDYSAAARGASTNCET